MNKEQHLAYRKLIINKGKVVIVPQPGSKLSPKRYQIYIYLRDMNYYAIKKTFTVTP